MRHPRRIEADEDDAPGICGDCGGNGAFPPDWRHPCRTCRGTGEIREGRDPEDDDGPECGFDDEPRDRDGDAPAGWEP